MSYQEKPFIINGIESWIHCLNMKIDTPSETMLPDYHYHKYIEFLYSIKSDALAWISGNCFTFNEGDLIIINSNSPHDVKFSGYCNYICVKFWPQILYSDQQALFEFKYLLPFLIDGSNKKIFNKDELLGTGIPELIFEILSEWETKNSAYELIIRSNILRIFSWVFRQWSSTLSIKEKSIPESIKTAINYIGENFSTTNGHEVAKFCGLSYNHFSYLFKDSIGKSFSDYLLSLKVKEAEKLLITSDKSITDIALEIGFSSSSHFISKFKKINGVTPLKFRNQLI